VNKYEYLRPFATTARQHELLDALLQAKSNAAAAKILGIAERKLYKSLARIKKEASLRGVAPDHDMVHETAEGFVVKGTSTLYGEEGDVKAQWVKTQQGPAEALSQIREAISEAMDGYKGVYRPRKAPTSDTSDLLACYVMGDPHIGCYAHAEEAGENFDVKIAREDLLNATSRLVAVAPKTDHALIANLGDFFHADNRANTTTRGTPVDVDTRWPQVLQAGCMLMVDLITLALTKHPRVSVVNCIGNHDDHTSVMLSAFLAAYFHAEPRVEVLPTTNKFHYFQHGKTLIACTHGDTIKLNALTEIMATDKPEMWAQSQHRYWYTGHIHHTTRQELRGSVVESFRTLAAKDAWHMNSGYRSGRDMFCIVHDKEYGEVERHRCDIRRARDNG
tara:strand:+ start:269 stop:1441 length:1173 start_codon:yes stop_codon:yes gene_type:complete